MTRERLAELLEMATTALADIAYAGDLSEAGRRSKAKRVYEAVRKEWEGPGPDDDATGEGEEDAP